MFLILLVLNYIQIINNNNSHIPTFNEIQPLEIFESNENKISINLNGCNPKNIALHSKNGQLSQVNDSTYSFDPELEQEQCVFKLLYKNLLIETKSIKVQIQPKISIQDYVYIDGQNLMGNLHISQMPDSIHLIYPNGFPYQLKKSLSLSNFIFTDKEEAVFIPQNGSKLSDQIKGRIFGLNSGEAFYIYDINLISWTGFISTEPVQMKITIKI